MTELKNLKRGGGPQIGYLPGMHIYCGRHNAMIQNRTNHDFHLNVGHVCPVMEITSCM